MSKELRALAIVFAALGGLLVLGFIAIAIAFTVFVKHVASQPRDPASLARTARKIVSFDVPPGYEIASATDLGFSISTTLRPVARGSFRITLQGTRFPTNADSQAGGAAFGLTIAERIMGCAPGHTSDVTVSIHGKPTSMHVMRCATKNGLNSQAELVSFPGNVASVNLSAVGFGDDFDDVAVRKLLASVK
jgi:hypothetical protein